MHSWTITPVQIWMTGDAGISEDSSVASASNRPVYLHYALWGFRSIYVPCINFKEAVLLFVEVLHCSVKRRRDAAAESQQPGLRTSP